MRCLSGEIPPSTCRSVTSTTLLASHEPRILETAIGIETSPEVIPLAVLRIGASELPAIPFGVATKTGAAGAVACS